MASHLPRESVEDMVEDDVRMDNCAILLKTAWTVSRLPMDGASEVCAEAVGKTSPGLPEATLLTDDSTPSDESFTVIVELLHRVQGEASAWADDPSPQLGIPARLAAAVEALSHALSCGLVRQGYLKAVLATPAGAPVAADLQQLYCRGSLLDRFCCHSAVTQTPAAVADFLLGLMHMARAFTETAVDYEALV